MLAKMGRLYEVEKTIRKDRKDGEAVNYDKAAETRTRQAKPVLDGIVAWLEETQPEVLPKSPLGQAISYARSDLTALTRYTE